MAIQNPTAEDVHKLRTETGCGILEASRRLRLAVLTDAVRKARTVEDLKEAFLYYLTHF